MIYFFGCYIKSYRLSMSWPLTCLQVRWYFDGNYEMPMQFVWIHNLKGVIDLFHSNPSSSGEQLKHRKLAHEVKQPTAGCIAIFHKYCCYTKRGSITTNLITKSLGVYYWCFKIPQCGYMGHGLKLITFYVQKHIAALGMCHNPALVRDPPLGATASVKLTYYGDIYMRI